MKTRRICTVKALLKAEIAAGDLFLMAKNSFRAAFLPEHKKAEFIALVDTAVSAQASA